MKIYEHKAQYYETDQMGIIHHSNYIRWFEEARIDMLKQLGISYADVEEKGIVIPVVGVSCNYHEVTRFGEVLVVEVRLTKFNGVNLHSHIK